MLCCSFIPLDLLVESRHGRALIRPGSYTSI
jgi:hypothetical protein